MKTALFLMTALLSTMSLAQVKTTAKVTLANNYISRGVSFYNGGSAHAGSGLPVVQSQLETVLSENFSVSAFMSPVESINLDTFALEKDTEIDAFLNYSVKVTEDLSVGAALGHYSFLKNEGNATSTVGLNAMYSFIRVDWMRTSKYSGLKTSLDYTMLSLWIPVSEKVMLTPSVGQSSWGDDSQVGMSSYTDYKIGVKLMLAPDTDLDIAYTNTTGRKDLLVTQEEIKTDKAVTFSLTKSFGL